VLEAAAAAEAGLKALEEEALAVVQDAQAANGSLATAREGADGAAAREAVARAAAEDAAGDASVKRAAAAAAVAALDGAKKAAEASRASAAAARAALADGGAEPEPLTPDQLAAIDLDALASSLADMEARLALDPPDLSALAKAVRAAADAAAKTADLDAATDARNAVRAGVETLRRKRLDEFMEGFATVSLGLKDMYRQLTLGGDAELELVDSLDPFAEGVVFSVRPPKKAWKNIGNLSGGEKTLSSLALVFALHAFKPTPLYVMDEIDAALDFRNVSIIAHYVKERTAGGQFIIISLRSDMFELADRLVGVYKTHDATKSVAVDPVDYACAGAPLPAAGRRGGAAAAAVVGGAPRAALAG
jgi:structural maintenance of chromosome 4